MSEAATTVPEFPFVAGLPQVVVEEARKGIDAFKRVVREYQDAQAKHGLLVPPSTVAEALGVSAQRVFSLMEEGRLAAVEVTGRRWIVADSVVAYLAAGPKPAGRPRKLSKVANSYRVGRELAAAAECVTEKG